MSARMLVPARDTRMLLIKWIVALIVPVAVITFVWSGEQFINAVLAPGTVSRNLPTDPGTLIQIAVFIAIFYIVVMTLAGYLVAADSGRSGMLKLWVDVAVFAVIPLLLVIAAGLIFGLAFCVVLVWPLYFFLRRRVRKALTFPPPLRLNYLTSFTAEKINKWFRLFVVNGFRAGVAAAVAWLLYNFLLLVGGQLTGQRLLLGVGVLIGLPIAGALLGAVLLLLLVLLDMIVGVVIFPFLYLYLLVQGGNGQTQAISSAAGNANISFAEERVLIMGRATAGGFWFATTFSLLWLLVDLIYYFSGSLPASLLIWVAVRTIALPVLGYFLGMVGGLVALRRTRAYANSENRAATNGGNRRARRASSTETLSNGGNGRVKNRPADVVPNDLPLRSTGATRFYLILLVAFVLFFPVLDPYLFGFGSAGRITQYGDAGYYVILALGLNIVVGFAGLLDLGYVAFFAIGAYVWGIIGSPQIGFLITSIHVDPHIWPTLFWPFLIISALVAAFFGVLLGAPTLRLRGDYLAIVTLAFGEIVPIVFLELDNVTKGANGLPGVFSPDFPGVVWNGFTPIPYYYLILALIALTIFINIRLRDSRMGRAWIAIREDEIAASSSGVNLVNTKLLAFGTGAFFSGLAGAFHAAKLGIISPDAFSFGDSIIYLAMVVIGGIGSIPGVIVGALVVYSVNELILANLDTIVADPTSALYPILNPIYQVMTHIAPGFTFGNVRNLIFGTILVVIMIFRPEGLIPSARRKRELHSMENEPAEAEMSSMDVVPGAPGFEQEVRVE
jgi:ABC-type branched-subunit amino acid transport system permease subunit